MGITSSWTRRAAGFAVILLFMAAGPVALAQLPAGCDPPATARSAFTNRPAAAIYSAVGAWFAQQNNLSCSATAFQQALKLKPHAADVHFDLGLVRQRQGQPTAAAREFRLALGYDPTLLQARCALGSVLSDPSSAEEQFKMALAANQHLVCALDGVAQVLAGRQEYDAAAGYWRRALREDPGAPDLELSLAKAIYKAAVEKETIGASPAEGSTVADAIRILTEVLAAHPADDSARLTLGDIYANEKSFRKAASEYGMVVRRNPGNWEALGAEVKALINVSAYSEALEPARDFVRQRPGEPEAHILLGTAYVGLGEYAKAEPELERGVAMEPDNFEAQYQLGVALERMEKPAQALPHLQKAFALKPASRPVQVPLMQALRSLGQTQQQLEIADLLKKEANSDSVSSRVVREGSHANELLKSGEPAQAVEIYRSILKESPGSASTEYNLALALEATHDTSGAEDALRRAIALDPKQPRARAELGKLELAAGNLQSAKKWLQSAVALQPDFVDALDHLAVVYEKQGQLLAAEGLLHRAITADPESVESHLNLGLLLVQQGLEQDAEKELNKAAALAPKDPVTLSTVGKVELKMGRTDDGLARLQKVVSLEPKLAAAHLDLALAFSQTHQLTAALDQTSDAIRLAPQSGVVHFYRGQILYDLGRSAEAQPEFEAARRLAPQMARPWYFLGLINMQNGKYLHAADMFEEAAKLEPNNTMALYMLGQCFEHESENTKAIAAWRKAVEIDPNFSQALFSLARALHSTDPGESAKFMAQCKAVQKDQLIQSRANLLANQGIEAASNHNWHDAVYQLKRAIATCGDCSVKASLHRKLGIIDCQAGDLDSGRKELLKAKELNPTDPVTLAALELAAQAQSRQAPSVESHHR